MTFLRSIAATGILALAPLAGAQAAPQILGLVATAGPVELECVDGTCRGEFGTICLQRDRDPPKAGTPYRVVGDVKLVAMGRDGMTRVMDLPEGVEIASARSFIAVRISVPETVLAELGAETVALAVGGGASLVPQPVAGDASPHSEQEIALVTGPLRQAARWLDDPADPDSSATRLASRLINELPADAEASEDQITAAYDRVVEGVAPGEGLDRVTRQFTACRDGYGRPANITTRQCMEQWHDSVLTHVNLRYWSLTGPGV